MERTNPRAYSGLILTPASYLQAIAIEAMRWCPSMSAGGFYFACSVWRIVERDPRYRQF